MATRATVKKTAPPPPPAPVSVLANNNGKGRKRVVFTVQAPEERAKSASAERSTARSPAARR